MPKKLTVVFCRDRFDNAAQQQMATALLAGLSHRPGIDLAVLPHLYDLAPDGAAVRFLRGLTDDLILLGWLYPRAAYWVLDANGVRGRLGRGSLPADEATTVTPSAATHSGRKRRLPDRTIWCLDLRNASGPEAVIAELEGIIAESLGSPVPPQLPTGGPNGTTCIEEMTEPRWYPVVDYDLCDNCGECREYCAFEVFGVNGGDTLLVLHPDDCFDGCPACARICPTGAIMFPHHEQPAIAGDRFAPRDGMRAGPPPAPGMPTPEELARAERERAIWMARRHRRHES